MIAQQAAEASTVEGSGIEITIRFDKPGAVQVAVRPLPPDNQAKEGPQG